MQEAKIVALITLVAWPLIAQGGASPATSIAWSLACLLYLAVARPALDPRLDAALVLLLACMAVQLLPLPAALVELLRPVGVSSAEGDGRSFGTVTLDPALTARALLHVAAVAALLVATRHQLAEGGVRRLTRAIVGLGGIVSAAAILEEVTSGGLALWTSGQAGPQSFGPFGDRNHFATWTAMALPLALGYATARRRAHPSSSRHGGSRRTHDAFVELRAWWLAVAAVMMTLALVLSRSRSGLMAIGVAGMFSLILVRDRLDPRGRRALMSAIVFAALASFSWSAVPPRPGGTAGTSTGRAASPRAEDLAAARVSSWLTGGGAGTSRLAAPDRDGRAAPRSHYLKAAAEGGLLLAAPLVLTGLALVNAARKPLKRDITPIWWLRLGSACGLGAVALQSTSQSGLAIPANSALAAILAAILIHDRQRTGQRENGRNA